MKIITTKQDENGECYLDLDDVLKDTNIKKEEVEYYSLEVKENKSLVLTLFDKDKNKLKVKSV